MQNKIALVTVIILSIINIMLVSQFSMLNAIFSTAIGLFFSITWLLVFSKVLADKDHVDGIDKKFNFVDFLYLTGPGLLYYLTIWGLALSVNIYQ